MTMRNLARASATGVLAVSALAFAATPALAADVDLGISLKGTTIAAGAEGKPATLNLTNHGTTKPTEVGVTFDATKLDQYKVTLELGECTLTGGVAECTLDPSAIPGPGETTDLDVQLVKTGGAGSTDAGSLKITIFVKGDTNKANDTATAKVTVENQTHGADLRVLALDVTAVDDEGVPTGKAIPPGETSYAEAYLANHGDYIASGLTVQVKLPVGATFTAEEGCDLAADKRTITCTAEDATLLPWDLDGSANKEDSAIRVFFEVTVSKDAKGPVSLTGGTWTAAALGARKPELDRRSRLAATPLPEFARELSAAEVVKVEVDASDNTDGFAVLVAGPTGGSGGGSGDDGPSLPVTGPVAASIGGAGAAVLALGAFLFISTRRRRVVLVTPADGK